MSWKEGQKVKWSICLHIYVHIRSGAFLGVCVCVNIIYIHRIMYKMHQNNI